jgi:hypothetical protein
MRFKQGFSLLEMLREVFGTNEPSYVAYIKIKIKYLILLNHVIVRLGNMKGNDEI